MNTQIFLGIFGSLCLILAFFLGITAENPELDYGRLTIAIFLFWLSLILFRALKDRLWPFEADSFEQKSRRAWLRLPLNLVLVLIPALTIIWLSLYSPIPLPFTTGRTDVCTLDGTCLAIPSGLTTWSILLIALGPIAIWRTWPRRNDYRTLEGGTTHGT